MRGLNVAAWRLIALVPVLLVASTLFTPAQEPSTSSEQIGALQSGPSLRDPNIAANELAHALIPLTKGELDELADAWLAIVRGKTQEIADRQIAFLQEGANPTDADFQALAMLVEERANLFERFSMVVAALQSKGGDEERLSELRAYRDSVLLSETILANPRAIAGAFFKWLFQWDGGLALLIDFGVVILAFMALLFVSGSARSLMKRWIRRIPRISKLLKTFVIAAVYWVVLAIGLVFVLAVLGVNVTPLFAMIGGASFILAFAFQDTLGNLASGLMIMVNRPFDEGDYVIVNGISGTVKSVSIVATTVTTPDNQVIVVPNKNVWGNVITNVTASDTRRVDLVFGIAYEDSIPDALKVIEKVVGAHALILPDPEPVIRVNELAASSVNIICRPWAKTSDYWSVYWDLTHHVKEAFAEAGISIPYPQQDVHIKK